MFTTFATNELVIVLFMGLLVLAAEHDAREYRIPNRICLAIVLLYPVHVLSAVQPVDWLGGAAVAAAVFAVGTALFVLRTMGGGDVKMMAAAALWAGPGMVFEFLVLTAFAGGAMAVLMVTPLRFGLAIAAESAGRLGLRDALLRDVLPYGIAIAFAGCFVGAALLRGTWS